ncbi:MAG: metalloregulator ArsR/SmtB family transcription factor [Tepidisphaeraceae bacterium]|jgi:DNA-binding transcriptional ArsR family regulator
MVTASHRHSDAVFKAIADPTRRRILGLLRSGDRTVGEIASHFPTSRPAISKHLRLLRSAGLIAAQKKGTTRFCALNAAPLESIDAWLRDYQSLWADNLSNLKSYLEDHS